MPEHKNAVRFILDGQPVSVRGLAPTTTVLEYLRTVAGRTGTKEGCAEGDCGACTVVVGELAPDGSRIRYRAVNSCIRLLPTIDGQELVTVESLQGADGRLHPVQQAMVDEHGSQCGFCTPGFVMSLFALYLENAAPDRDQVLEALSGNLCRCTGYRPIVAAALRMGAYPAPPTWSRAEPASAARRAALAAIADETGLELDGFLAPTGVEELEAALERHPDATILAGGTDVGLWITKQLRRLPYIIHLGRIGALKTIRIESQDLVIGAAVTLTDAWDAIVASYPQLRELAGRFGSPPVRNSGTLCGNLANGSPIGDSMPILIALGAEVELRRAGAVRRLPLEDLYLGYGRKALQRGEFLAAVRLPLPRAGSVAASYKVSKRFDQDISAVCAGFALRLDGGRVAQVRIAYGGMAAVPARARAVEQVLQGGAWDAQGIEAAVAALASDFRPLSDMRASAAYRLLAAGNLLRRFHRETGTAPGPLRTAAAAGL